MNKKLSILTASLLALALLGRPISAFAQDDDIIVDPYRYGMPGLMEVIVDWEQEADSLLDSATVKPELVCSGEQVELVKRGQSMVDDFVGTGTYAPQNLSQYHGRAVQGLQAAVNGLSAAGAYCDGSALATGNRQFEAGRFRYQLYSGAIERYLNGVTFGNS